MIFNFFPKKTAEEYLAKAKRRQDNRHIKLDISHKLTPLFHAKLTPYS